MRVLKMGFDSNIREIKRNFTDLQVNNETMVEPNNLKDFMEYFYGAIGDGRSITVTPMEHGGTQLFMVQY